MCHAVILNSGAEVPSQDWVCEVRHVVLSIGGAGNEEWPSVGGQGMWTGHLVSVLH